jgi:hypothetical protein
MRPTKFSSTCFFYPFSACHLYISGKAEAGSAGEQPARNNLIDWNGQQRLWLSAATFIFFFDHSGRLCLEKTHPFSLS